MTFFDTSEGREFAVNTAPRLAQALEHLTEQLQRTNALLSYDKVEAASKRQLLPFDFLLQFAAGEKDWDMPISRNQFKSLWTAYCICNNLEVGVDVCNEQLLRLWSIVVKERSNPFVDYNEFDEFMCEFLIG